MVFASHISQFSFGRLSSGEEVDAIRLESGRLSAVFINYGMRLVSLEYRTRSDHCQQVIRGGQDLTFFENDKASHGAVVGRTCNRIRNGQLSINGRDYQLDQNEGSHHLHGGHSALQNRLWKISAQQGAIVGNIAMADGESGYPGNVELQLRLSIEDDALVYRYSGVSDQDTLVDLTNHTYFCLDDSETVLDHELQVNANCFVPIDDDKLPLGHLFDVSGTPFDLTQPTRIGAALDSIHPQLALAKGFDHCWLLAPEQYAAWLRSRVSGIELGIETSSPGLQVYSGNALTKPRQGICLETQHLPDACHHEDFQTPMVCAGQPFESFSRYQFRQFE